MKNIHPTAIIDKTVELAEDVYIGPYTCISGNVKIAGGARIEAHVVIGGNTTIGEKTHIYPFASVGLPPQDLKFKGEESTLIIGNSNIIREHVTINPGTEGGGMKTVIGNDCLLMIGSHVAHDCVVGNRVILANNATLAGHVTIGDYAIIGGLSAIHQFVRIGHHAMIGGMSGIESDVVPYASATGDRAKLAGLNIIGLKRRNFSRDNIHSLRAAYRMLFSAEGTIEERVNDVAEMFGNNRPVMEIIEFIRNGGQRSLCLPKNVMENVTAS